MNQRTSNDMLLFSEVNREQEIAADEAMAEQPLENFPHEPAVCDPDDFVGDETVIETILEHHPNWTRDQAIDKWNAFPKN